MKLLFHFNLKLIAINSKNIEQKRTRFQSDSYQFYKTLFCYIPSPSHFVFLNGQHRNSKP